MMTSKTQQVSNVTNNIIYKIWRNGNPDKGVLSKLRQFKSIDEAQPVWSALLPSIPDEMLSNSDNPTYEEQAIFAAVHLYAMNQQSKDYCVHDVSYGDGKGIPLFKALRQLAINPDNAIGINRQINQLFGVTSFQQTEKFLTHTIQIAIGMSGHLIIDYGRLASDLYNFQFNRESAKRVHFVWGQDYFGNTDTTDNK